MHREIGDAEALISRSGVVGNRAGIDSEVGYWDKDGLLPLQGVQLTTEELIKSAFVSGNGSSYAASWDRNRRERMTKNVIKRIETLRQAEIDDFVISGDYVEDVARPRMALGYFLCDRQDFMSRDLEKRLNEIDPDNHWSWEENNVFGKHPMWAADSVELWPVLKIPGMDPMYFKPREIFHSNSALEKPKGVITIRR